MPELNKLKDKVILNVDLMRHKSQLLHSEPIVKNSKLDNGRNADVVVGAFALMLTPIEPKMNRDRVIVVNKWKLELISDSESEGGPKVVFDSERLPVFEEPFPMNKQIKEKLVCNIKYDGNGKESIEINTSEKEFKSYEIYDIQIDVAGEMLMMSRNQICMFEIM